MKITFWMKAFIPYHVPDVTKIIPNSNNESMILGPPEVNTTKSTGEVVKSVVIPGYAVYDTFRRYGYRTDQRGFDYNYFAKSRMNCAFNLLLDGDDLRNARLDNASSYNHCDKTVAVDAASGSVLKTGQAPNTNMSFTQGTVTQDCFNVYMNMAAADPVVLGANLVANINFSGNISIRTIASNTRAGFRVSLSTHILLDNFPAFEAYAAINESHAFNIFQTMPLPGYTVLDLIDEPRVGQHMGAGIYEGRSRIERHTIIDTDGDGAFDTLR